jgi:hypothetical protein
MTLRDRNNPATVNSVQAEIDTLSEEIHVRLRHFFGESFPLLTAVEVVAKLVRQSLQEAYFVPCVGLPFRIPLLEIFQLSRVYDQRQQDVSPNQLIEAVRDHILTAWPGIGKTTLLSYIFIQMAKNSTVLPLLFMLRIDGSVKALVDFISALRAHKEATLIPGSQLVLLIDGFDEVTDAERVAIGKALRDFQSFHYGTFCLSCRLYYDTSEVNATTLLVQSFEKLDAIRYASCFFQYAIREGLLRKDIDANQFIEDLISRKLFGLISVPLLLSLACVVKSESEQTIPTNAVELLDRAIELLNERWDRIRHIRGRDTVSEIGAWKRLRLLKKIANDMPGREAPDAFLEAIIKKFVTEHELFDLNPASLLTEIAQHSGLMRRSSAHMYQFMHGAIQDFLAAKYLVETGSFFPTTVDTWGARAGFAACLSGDATQSMVLALRHGIDNVAFNDCLLNGASFDHAQVAREVVRQLRRAPIRVVVSSKPCREPNCTEVKLSHDFFAIARPRFISALLAAALLEYPRDNAVDVLVGYCLWELRERKLTIDSEKTARDFVAMYRSLEMRFAVHKVSNVATVSAKELVK